MRNQLNIKSSIRKDVAESRIKKQVTVFPICPLGSDPCMIDHFCTISALLENKTQATETRFGDHLFYNEKWGNINSALSHAK